MVVAEVSLKSSYSFCMLPSWVFVAQHLIHLIQCIFYLQIRGYFGGGGKGDSVALLWSCQFYARIKTKSVLN